MKVKLIVQMSGTRNGEDWPAAGEVVDLPKDEAAHLVAGGLALEVAKADAAPESAAMTTKPRRK